MVQNSATYIAKEFWIYVCTVYEHVRVCVQTCIPVNVKCPEEQCVLSFINRSFEVESLPEARTLCFVLVFIYVCLLTAGIEVITSSVE